MKYQKSPKAAESNRFIYKAIRFKSIDQKLKLLEMSIYLI